MYKIIVFAFTLSAFSCLTSAPEMQDIEFIPVKTGFQGTVVSKGLASYARHDSVYVDIYIKDRGNLNHEALRTWLSDFTGARAAVYVALGADFVLERVRGITTAKISAEGTSPAYSRLQRLDRLTVDGFFARFLVRSENLLLPPVTETPNLYFFRGVYIENLDSVNTDVREIDFLAVRALEEFVLELDKQGFVGISGGRFWLAEHKIVLLDDTRIGIQISLYVDFR